MIVALLRLAIRALHGFGVIARSVLARTSGLQLLVSRHGISIFALLA